MKRSEALQYALDELSVDCSRCVLQKNCADCRVEIMRNVLLAEQKREEGCAYCHSDMLDGYALENINGKYPKIIGLSMRNCRSIDQLPISFCPNCGRSLTDGESE